MKARMCVCAIIAIATVSLAVARSTGQDRGEPARSAGNQPATVETAALTLIDPTPFQVVAVLEPIRWVPIRAPSDGLVREIAVEPGDLRKKGELIARLDPSEAQTRLKMADAQLKAQQAELQATKAASSQDPGPMAILQARMEVAQAQVELARLGVAGANLSAPIDGRVLSVPAAAGQFVVKGETIAEIADVSAMRVLIPVDRVAVKSGATLTLAVEGRPVEGKVHAMVPLPESFAVLRGLDAPLSGAWVAILNKDGSLEPGFRVRSPFLPDAPLAVVDERAVKRYADGTSSVQVLRDERVTTLRVKILGPHGFDRLQISGPMRVTDALILGASVPLTDGTIVRFDGATAPGGTAAFNPNVAPIGAAGPAPGAADAKGTTKSTTKTAPAKTGTPF